jgi:hypothetical protein
MKKITVHIAAFALSLLLPCVAPAATKQPKETIQQFFEFVQKNDVESSLKTLFNDADINGDGKKEINSGIQNAIAFYGTPIRFDLVSEIKKGPVVVELIYTLSFAARPLVWKFYAYQTSGHWIIIDAKFNDKMDLLD